MSENSLAWRIWNIANSRDRQITEIGLGPLSSVPILHLCELYDATDEDFEKVLMLDGLLYHGPEGAKAAEDTGDKEPAKPKIPRTKTAAKQIAKPKRGRR